ncbi:HAL/PAL/TAL family ammonia-lyase [Halomonas huangheensis]|uniref:Histidine ammonia-lyase n=1 Tax=Halomonas huangheensis TaxID=1178482 RepID=W1NAC4_9GAMM|nr:histidine ammonia-lyase [Halomonas huangheensis]ALM53470.1 histidine ammonia-lyase [Halomonas huangheensis]ERL51855.1 hypothetical protein BJB45_11865 [Halomonas huangheensis]
MNDVQAVQITTAPLGWQLVVAVARDRRPLELSGDVRERIAAARQVVEKIARSDKPHYGINTGLGALCHVVLKNDELARLSRHTLMSHACGVGEALRGEQVRAIMCCAVANYSQGHSGISPHIVDALVECLNHDIIPVVPAQGSVGYLSHMAHIGLALIGEGEVLHRGQRRSAEQALAEENIAPAALGPKDGLSLVNGTPAMTGLACLALADTEQLANWADTISAMSFEALRGQRDAFDDAVIRLKAQPGIQTSARHLRHMIEGSEWLEQCHADHLQDALSLRAIPQVHGACRDQFNHAARQIDGELNSATDNPLVIATQDGHRIVSQANPHGASVAMACDLLAIAVCEWSSISERRSYRLVTPQANQLPPFLSEASGVKSGMMIAQYSAASLVADNKRLAQPAVTDNYLTSGLQEDHLSLGESAALKLDQALSNGFHVLGIEYLLAGQALDLIEGSCFGHGTEEARSHLRHHIDFYDEEHPLHRDMAAASQLLRSTSLTSNSGAI